MQLLKDSALMLADLLTIRENGRRGVYREEPRPGSRAYVEVRPFAGISVGAGEGRSDDAESAETFRAQPA